MFSGKRNLRESFYVDFSKDDNFEEIFKCYYAPLCYYAKSIVGDYLYEDLVSAVFVKLYEKKVKFNDLDQFLAYIYTAVKNACLDYIKLDKRREKREDYFFSHLEVVHQENWETIVQNEVWAETYRELKELPSQCQKVIALGYLEGLSNSQIANELNLSLQTVKNHKYRALKILKEKLIKFSTLLICFKIF